MMDNLVSNSASEPNWIFVDFSFTKVLDKLVNNNPNLPIGACMGIAMRQLRGKVSAEQVVMYLRSLGVK